ncbi:hypothetical protein D9758_010742 [Tetrapyrgos nigripes]|uniref:HNH nuclease domain-containing protein n=1 Tax=Tetrapyrgos nigripes TaxID=182062 RepID=A0A8H5D802_9AGAR|nr:hypothetical protein D9758_010742 [Tetrapyrgos nigripes]
MQPPRASRPELGAMTESPDDSPTKAPSRISKDAHDDAEHQPENNPHESTPGKIVGEYIRDLDGPSKKRHAKVVRIPDRCNITQEKGKSPGNDVDWSHIIPKSLQKKDEMRTISRLLGVPDLHINTRGNVMRLSTDKHRTHDGGQWIIALEDLDLLEEIVGLIKKNLKVDQDTDSKEEDQGENEKEGEEEDAAQRGPIDLVKMYNPVPGERKWTEYTIVPLDDNLKPRRILQQVLDENPDGTFSPREPDGLHVIKPFADFKFKSHLNLAIVIVHAALRIRDRKIYPKVQGNPSLLWLYRRSEDWFNQKVPKSFLARRKKALEGYDRNEQTPENAPPKDPSVADTDDRIIVDQNLNVLPPGPDGQPFPEDIEAIEDIVAAFNNSPSAGPAERRQIQAGKAPSVITAESLEENMFTTRMRTQPVLPTSYYASFQFTSEHGPEVLEEFQELMRKFRDLKITSSNHPGLQASVKLGAPPVLWSRAHSVKSAPGGSESARSGAGDREEGASRKRVRIEDDIQEKGKEKEEQDPDVQFFQTG